ncbi:hypothetical protein ACA910_008265 [Epithemia clementina (nom. ined.)]
MAEQQGQHVIQGRPLLRWRQNVPIPDDNHDEEEDNDYDEVGAEPAWNDGRINNPDARPHEEVELSIDAKDLQNEQEIKDAVENTSLERVEVTIENEASSQDIEDEEVIDGHQAEHKQREGKETGAPDAREPNP